MILEGSNGKLLSCDKINTFDCEKGDDTGDEYWEAAFLSQN
jgi:hypothetical protein